MVARTSSPKRAANEGGRRSSSRRGTEALRPGGESGFVAIGLDGGEAEEEGLD